MRLELTEDGRWTLLGCGALAVVVLATGNNLVAMLLSVALALLFVGAVLTRWNLRGLEVQRRLPPESFAGRASHGRWVLSNRRRLMAARALRIREAHGDAEAAFAEVEPGGRATAAATWSFADRGVMQLDRWVLTSSFPFGLWDATVEVSQPVEVLVYPRPVGAHGDDVKAFEGEQEGDRAARGGLGDLLGLRDYQVGDRLTAIHWRATARRGKPVVVERAGDVGRAVHIEVPGETDPARWERALSRACGAVLSGFAAGYAVGLTVGDERLAPERGGAWRRRLLATLGAAPRRE